jgi:hypothetical protein
MEGEEMRRILSLALLSLLFLLALPAGRASAAEDADDDPGFDVAITTSQEILRPGDPFTATVVLINTSGSDLTDLSVQLELQTQAVRLAPADSVPDAPEATINPGGIVTWEVETLAGEETLTLGVSGTVAPEVVSLKDIPVTATVSQNQIQLAGADTTLQPIITVVRSTSVDRSPAMETIVTSLEVTPNAALGGLTVTETLTELVDAEPVRPTAIKRVDNAQVSAGRVEWSFPTVEMGKAIQLEYSAEYPAVLNLGDFAVNVAGSINDDTSELFFSGEESLEIRTPLITLTGPVAQDDSPDDAIRPGDTAAVSIVVENGGKPIDGVRIVATVDGTTLGITDAEGSTFTESSAIWVRTVGVAPVTLDYTVTVKSDILEDRSTDLVAQFQIDDTLIRSNTESFLVDTERRTDSNTGQWFALILLFMVMGFGTVLFFARKRDSLGEHTAYVALVLAILAAILILAFGLELASETTLTLLGAIAGYVLGQRQGGQKANKKS